MRLIEKYKIVKVGIILIVLGVAWLYTVNYDLSKLALVSICSGLVFISECEEEEGTLEHLKDFDN